MKIQSVSISPRSSFSTAYKNYISEIKKYFSFALENDFGSKRPDIYHWFCCKIDFLEITHQCNSYHIDNLM